MEFESIKRLGLDHYNIDLVKSYEAYDSIHDNHIIFIHLNKDDRVYCPCCGSITFISKGTKSSEFKYSSSLEKNIIIKLYRHVYKCQDCGRLFKEENPFTQTKKRITIQKDIQILTALKDKSNTFSKVAKEFNVSPTYVLDLFDRKVDLKRLLMPTVLCIDEVYAKKLTKHSYCCVLYAPQRKMIVDVLDSRWKIDLIDYFSRIPIKEKQNIKFISMDMWEGYRQMAKLCLPQAKICVDSFHVIQHLNLAFQKIRIKVMNKYEHLKSEESNYYWLFKKYYKFLLTDTSNLPDTPIKVTHSGMYLYKGQIINHMLSLSKELELAYELKEKYRSFNSTTSVENANKFLDELILEFKISKIEEYSKFITLMENWHDEIVNSFNRVNGYRVSNGPMERVNRDIKTILNLSFGSNNFARLRNRIIFSINESAPILYTRKSTNNNRVGKKRGPYNK